MRGGSTRSPNKMTAAKFAIRIREISGSGVASQARISLLPFVVQ